MKALNRANEWLQKPTDFALPVVAYAAPGQHSLDGQQHHRTNPSAGRYSTDVVLGLYVENAPPTTQSTVCREV